MRPDGQFVASESYSMKPNTTATEQLLASTPPSLAFVQSPETPARPKTAPSATFRTDPKLLNKLNELVSGLPEFISEISVDDYFNHVLPPLPSHLENKVGEVCNILNRNGTYNTTTHRWTLFPQDPATQPSHETQDFLPLADVFNAIVQAAQQLEPGLEPNFKLVVDSLATPMSERGDDMRPDGYFKITDKVLNEMRKKCEVLMKKEGWKDVPKTKTPEAPHETTNDSEPKKSLRPLTNTGEKLKRPPPPPVYGITAPQEFKKQGFTEDLENDIIKLMWNMSSILALDPCRRFTLGFTIEDRWFRLWILNRGTLLRTQAFDFIKDQRSLVTVFLSFAFSSAENMGWDPTITFSHLDSHNRRQYNIIANERVYKTVTTLSDYSADNPLGRATRVWKVQDAQGKTRVLKDLWLKHDRLEEHQIYENILKDVENSAKPEHREKARNAVAVRLLTPLEHCRVKVSGIADDDTNLVILRGYDMKNAQTTPLMSPSKPNPPKKQSIGFSFSDDQDAEFVTEASQDSGLQVPQRVVHNSLQETEIPNDQRYHYRIVFQEYATTIYDERNLANILKAIADVLFALRLIHSAGWVHRDISGGNLYYHKERNIGLIGDLEYAKKVEIQSHRNVRAGTPHFMASEAISNAYLFYPYPITPKPPRAPLKLYERPPPSDTPLGVVEPAPPPFNHNALHDIESVWWVLVYTILFNEDAAGPSQNTSARQHLMNKLFSGQLNNNSRLPFLRNPQFGTCLPSSFSSLVPGLQEYARRLTAAFAAAEMNYPIIQPLASPQIHGDCIRAFYTKPILGAVTSVEMTYVKIRAQDVPGSSQKRSGNHLDEPEGSQKKKSRRMPSAPISD
ncbi:hypothetical protein GGU10DRAFT_391420 [Lentinula aff. detonsa]|uniref:Protein kinase domain-containing protein n=1 Tax=Lentinula aff. detonsa TaxID=2804958 RepID=A0AA38L2B5_9AGAR|nr:hypothetical protein GGU10DRAFT_391420 [Lentinula aff. detonsa]